MCTYLHQRFGSPVYYFRRPVPAPFRPFIGKREWMISLRTKDRAEAKRLIPDLTKATDAELDRAREALAAATQPAAPDHAPAGSPAPAIGMSEGELEAAEVAAQEAAEQHARQEARWNEVDRLAKRLRLPTKELPETEAAMADLLRAERERREEAEHQRDMAEARARVAKAKREASAPASAEPALEGEPVKLEPLLDAYAAEHGSRAKRGFASSKTHVRSLRDFLPSDDARLATPARMIAWKDHLLRPVAEGGKGLETKTVRDGYLATVRAMFAWAAMNGRIESNPVQGLKVRVAAKPKVRERAFTDAEAVKVLAATLKPRPELSAPYQLACRWAPWLLAYSGARVAEIGALRAEDVMEVDGVWVMNLTPEAGPKKDKKYRHVPLHSHLIEQGFVAVAKAKKSGPLFYDPEAWTSETAGGKGPWDKVGEKLRAVVREVGITADMIPQPTHSWRHRVKSRSADYGIEERLIDALQGHAAASQGRRYFDPTIAAKAAAIEKLPRYEVPGLPSVVVPS